MADAFTQSQTAAEYTEASDARYNAVDQHRLTRLRVKPSVLADSEVVEILSFLAYELVRDLTTRALALKAAEPKAKELQGICGDLKRSSIFAGEMEQGALEEQHIEEAWRNMQMKNAVLLLS